MDNIEKRIRLLYKKVRHDGDTTERDCEGYIKILNGIKNELIDNGKLGEWDLEDVQLGGILGVSEEDVDEAMEEIESQIDEIASGLGIDLDEETQATQSNLNSPAAIHIYNTQLQHQEQIQSQNQNVNVRIESLKKELENELKKDNPSEYKIGKTLSEIINLARESASGIIAGVILKVLGVY